jgi:putative ABC transport system ATP-binding protein
LVDFHPLVKKLPESNSESYCLIAHSHMNVLLHIQNLQKSYVSPEGERTRIIDVPHFEMNTGEQVALQGRSGSGKTTLLNLIAGILQADLGSIRLAGHEMCTLSESERDRVRGQNIGYIFQTFNLMQVYSALENVELAMRIGGGNLNRGFAKELLERAGLQDRTHYRPSQLSVGQQQRVAVARALANRPKLVLADEPTGNLDVHHAGQALQLIKEICQENNAALLLVSHDPMIQNHFDRVEQLANLNRAKYS